VIKYLQNLMKLDNNQVTTEEKLASRNAPFSLEVLNNSNNFKSEKQADYSEEKKMSKPAYFQYASVDPSVNEIETSENEAHREQNQYIEKLFKKGSSEQQKEHACQEAKEDVMNRNQNILMAVMSLLKELDFGTLEIVKKEVEKLQQLEH
jgi:hypothetical protein